MAWTRTGWRSGVLVAALSAGCAKDDSAAVALINVGHGPIAPDIMAPLGDPAPYATAEQLETFARGKEVALRRFEREDGLGPAFNVTFCAACHEKPVTGGSAGMYRNFFLAATVDEDGAYFVADSAGTAGGVVRMYAYSDDVPARPEMDPDINITGVRNPIPFFGVGLMAELDEAGLLSHEDIDDLDGDGVSGRANYDQGFVGRFGMKSQTVSIEGFIRGPLFNHAGITTDPLTDEQKARLPVDSSGGAAAARSVAGMARLIDQGQAAAPSTPLVDDDGVTDPELSTDDLFDLVSYAMLLAAPLVDEETEQSRRGQIIFDDLGCATCHVPRQAGPRGPVPLYSDLLIHDMGEDLADGIQQMEAEGYEFRTQPLWGLSAVGPYLHDGRATTIEDAIWLHGGEAQGARDRFEELSQDEVDDLVEFLMSLGGRDQYSTGLIAPGTPVPPPLEYGGPYRELSADELATFEAGRETFDHDFGVRDGMGNPRFNGDSCRACHFDPVVGGSGPSDVNVMRHGIVNADGQFVNPAVGSVLHKSTTLHEMLNWPQDDANVFEHRQTPHLFGLGLIESIPEETLLALADPNDDAVPDGISGKVSIVDGGRIGRFGWKAQVPTIDEFVRDAVTTELGMTLDLQPGLTFGKVQDNDDVADPEYDLTRTEELAFFLEMMAGPPRAPSVDAEAEAEGEVVFAQVGCDLCHVPVLDGAEGPVALYSDLLLHEILPADHLGIEEASAAMREFRTAPLWGLSATAPYTHTGEADTIDQAIRLHDGEAVTVRAAYEALTDAQRDALLAFLNTL